MSDFTMSVSRCQGQREAICWTSLPSGQGTAPPHVLFLYLPNVLCHKWVQLPPIDYVWGNNCVLITASWAPNLYCWQKRSAKHLCKAAWLPKYAKALISSAWQFQVPKIQSESKWNIYCDRQNAKRSPPLDSRTGTAWYKCWSRALWDCGPRVPGWPRWSLTHGPERRRDTFF